MRDNSFSGIFYQLKNGCNWGDLPRDLPPYSTVFWHYQNWFEHGSLERIEAQIHSLVGEQVKKNRSGRL
ncbi:transposase [Microcoleus sp. MOSTC5]|uniref:transposase n=1 Tax=Microcoleus sp. MOSTC5 TaxID=3055378 RepID=UPI0040407067